MHGFVKAQYSLMSITASRVNLKPESDSNYCREAVENKSLYHIMLFKTIFMYKETI